MTGVQGYGVRPSKWGGVRGTALKIRWGTGYGALRWRGKCHGVSLGVVWYLLDDKAFLRLEKRRGDRREFTCHHAQCIGYARLCSIRGVSVGCRLGRKRHVRRSPIAPPPPSNRPRLR